MKIRLDVVLGSALLLWCYVSAQADPPPTQAAGPPSALIINSGSTNMPGYRIAVWPTGKAIYTLVRRPTQRMPAPGASAPSTEPITTQTDPAPAKQLFADLAAAGPLSKFPAVHCMKSASFGYRLTVQYKGDESPDLSCPNADPKIKAIAADVDVLTKAVRASMAKPTPTPAVPPSGQ